MARVQVLLLLLAAAVVGFSATNPGAAGAGVAPAPEDVDPGIVCLGCVMVLGLVEQIDVQIGLMDDLLEGCNDDEENAGLEADASALCEAGVHALVYNLERKANPDELCGALDMCDDQCVMWKPWPVYHLPPAPEDWPTARRLRGGPDADFMEITKEQWEHVARVLRKRLLLQDSSTGAGIGPGLAGFITPAALAPARALIHSSLSMTSLQQIFGGKFSDVCEEGDMECVLRQYAKEMPSATEEGGINPCGYNISCNVERIADKHWPLFDADGDTFSLPEYGTLRGSHWRGADCDDTNLDVYPGRKDTTYGPEVDHNCNGISGSNDTGSYEDMLCDVEQRGLIMLGDSATAHFHIPPAWVTANGWDGLPNLEDELLDEFDVPKCSWGTGHVSPEECPMLQDQVGDTVGIESLYTRLRERNRCNHRDFQNIGVNGARSTSSMKEVDSAWRGGQDHPALVFYALIGNDVCNGHEGTSHMTDPDTFYDSVTEALQKLDTFLPPNSYVVMVGLVNGQVLYDTLYNNQHPLGPVYPLVYEELNCYGENPCAGWLTTNETMRDISTAWAESLNMQYEKIVNTQTYENFEMIFVDPKWEVYFNVWENQGKDPAHLIEPVDGFHPSQTGNQLFAKELWNYLAKYHPEALGPVNPHNDEIDALFGDQGGY